MPFDFNHDGVVDQADVNMLVEDVVDRGFYMAAGQTVVVTVTPEGTPSVFNKLATGWPVCGPTRGE